MAGHIILNEGQAHIGEVSLEEGAEVVASLPAGTIAALGATTDAKVITDASGSIPAFLRGLVTILADVWVSASHWLQVQLQSGEAHVGEVGGKILKSTVEITRSTATDVYSVNDVVGGASAVIFELPNAVRVVGGTAYLVGLRVITNLKSIVPAFRLHFFNASTPTISADNALWQDKYADRDLRVGYVDLPSMITAADTTNSDMSRAVDLTLRVPVKAAVASTSMWVAIETLTAFTPANGQKIYVVALFDVN